MVMMELEKFTLQYSFKLACVGGLIGASAFYTAESFLGGCAG